MPYMVYQQYATAIKEAYADSENAAELYIETRDYREWLQSLKIDVKLTEALIEPITYIEEAFLEIQSRIESQS